MRPFRREIRLFCGDIGIFGGALFLEIAFFCASEWLFYTCVFRRSRDFLRMGPFCEDTGLCYGDIGAIYGDVGFSCGCKGLFCTDFSNINGSFVEI